MQCHYILIDYENVQVKSLALLNGDHFRVRVFLGPKNTRLATELVLAMKELGERADYIVLEAGGHNALDFHITYYLGRLVAADPSGCYYIISKDTGFDSLIRHVNKTGVHCERSVSIEALPCIDPLPIENTVAVKTPVVAKSKSIVKKKTTKLVELVLANLAKRKRAAPRTEKTLRSTIRTLCGAQYSDKEIDAVFSRLVKSGYVVVDGAKVTYRLQVD